MTEIQLDKNYIKEKKVNTMKKVIYIIMIITIVMAGMCFNSKIYAESHSAGEVVEEADNFLNIGEQKANGIISKESMKNLTDTLYNILLVIAIIVAVLLGAILGIKFIMEGAEGKAEVQKALPPYVIGCIIAFGAFTIWKIVVIVLQGLE